jgi:hypothetical protein
VRERITSIDDIKKYLSQLVLSRPIPEWILRMLELFDQEHILPTYVYSRCRSFIFRFLLLLSMNKSYLQRHLYTFNTTLLRTSPPTSSRLGTLSFNSIQSEGDGCHSVLDYLLSITFRHGCTKACIEAVTLNSLLTKCAVTPTGNTKGTAYLLPKDFSRKFFHLQAKRTGTLWSILTSVCMRFWFN